MRHTLTPLLGGFVHGVIRFDSPQDGCVLCMEELSLSLALALHKRDACAVITRSGNLHSHVAAALRASGICWFCGALLPRDCARLQAVLLPDGQCIIDPPDSELRALLLAREQAEVEEQRLIELGQNHALHLPDGSSITLCSTLNTFEEAVHSPVGLVRSECLFSGAQGLPDEETQYWLYRTLMHRTQGCTTVRAFDFGDDKPAPFAANGLRGSALLLAHPQVLHAQLRALLRAADGCMRIVFPHVESVEVFRACHAAVQHCRAETGVAPVACGAMIESMQAAQHSHSIASEADFVYVGSNDLLRVHTPEDVLYLVETAAEAARTHNRSITLCGALCEDLNALPRLLQAGIRHFCLSPAVLPLMRGRMASKLLTGLTSENGSLR